MWNNDKFESWIEVELNVFLLEWKSGVVNSKQSDALFKCYTTIEMNVNSDITYCVCFAAAKTLLESIHGKSTTQR
jgi:hypothetical protein